MHQLQQDRWAASATAAVDVCALLPLLFKSISVEGHPPLEAPHGFVGVAGGGITVSAPFPAPRIP